MIIQLNKFGNTLSSRTAGREAWLAIQSILKGIALDEKIEVDFTGVGVLTPSWADEFITPLIKKFTPGQVVLGYSQNSSIIATIDLLKEIWKLKN